MSVTDDVLAEWRALPDDCRSPVKTIAARLGLSNQVVNDICFPGDQFTPWSDDLEPDLD